MMLVLLCDGCEGRIPHAPRITSRDRATGTQHHFCSPHCFKDWDRRRTA